jgi:hypothetical protein
MKILVERFHSTDEETYSNIYVDGKWMCFGLEDQFQEEKVFGETRIPKGIYKVGVKTVGGFHNRYSSKFEWHKGMLEVLDVPNFTDILLHRGNYDHDTSGCLLVGSDCVPTSNMVAKSTDAYERLYTLVISAAIEGILTIEYIDKDRY